MKKIFAAAWWARAFIIVLVSLTIITCSKTNGDTVDPKDGTCGIADPVNDLPWLKKLITNNGPYQLYEYAFIYSYVFKGRQVFYVWNSASTNSREIVFNCDGSELILFTSPEADWKEFENKRTDEVLLWQKTPDPGTSICGVKNPVTDLPWLRNIINGTNPKMYTSARIYAYMYKGKQVIYVMNQLSAVDPQQVYDCKGNIVIGFVTATATEWQEFWAFLENERTGEKLLWRKD